MKRVIFIIFSIILLVGCSREVSEVIEKYENGNWKKVIVYKVRGEKRTKYKAIEYYENGGIKHEIDLRKVKNYNTKPVVINNEPEVSQQDTDNDTIYEYTGPYADLMNKPGAVTRKLEGEEKQRVLEAMRKRKEEQQQGIKFTELNEDGEEVTKIRKIVETFEDGSTKHEQILVPDPGGPVLEKDINYYSNGQIRTYVPYVNGIAEGKWLNYYRNGKLKTEGHSQNGTHHGKYTQYYENGNPMMTGQFLNGKMEGVWKYYWENGNIKMETTFKEDKEIGPNKRYEKNGEPKKHQSPFRVGEKMNLDN